VEINTPAFAPGRESGGFESRDRIGWIVIRDAIAVVIQAGLRAVEERQPAFAGGEESFFSCRFQAKVFLIPFLRALHVGHSQRDVVEIAGIKGGGRLRRIGCGATRPRGGGRETPTRAKATAKIGERETPELSRSVLRSEDFWLQNSAILRNALRKRNYELPSVSNDMQSSETLRNSLGSNYKSAALPLSYAGKSAAHIKAP
jgi:hypothetical protein